MLTQECAHNYALFKISSRKINVLIVHLVYVRFLDSQNFQKRTHYRRDNYYHISVSFRIFFPNRYIFMCSTMIVSYAVNQKEQHLRLVTICNDSNRILHKKISRTPSSTLWTPSFVIKLTNKCAAKTRKKNIVRSLKYDLSLVNYLPDMAMP